MKTKVILYCGEFDPPHLGHLDTAILAFNYMKYNHGYEKLLFVPTGTDVFGISSVAPISHMRSMLSLMIASFSSPYFEVADFDINMNSPLDIIKKVEALKTQYNPVMLIELDQAIYLNKRRCCYSLTDKLTFVVTNKAGQIKEPSNFLLRDPNIFIKAYPYTERISLLSLRIDAGSNQLSEDFMNTEVANFIKEKSFYISRLRGKE